MELECIEMDTVKLISLYEAALCVYDVTSIEYRNKDKKREKEKRMATELGKSD
jgi:hypothetical protein